ADINWAFYVDALTFLISAICVYRIQVKPIQAEEETSTAMVIKNLRAGVRQLFSTPVLRSLFLVQAIVLVSFGLSNTLLLPFALKALNATEFEYGLPAGLHSIGFVVGGVLVGELLSRLQ